jgi:probable selenium-dependent hydroxylase accessory protein YqeC
MRRRGVRLETVGVRVDTKEERRSRVGGVVLAAGLSQRFGANKLLAWFMGKPLVHWTVESALRSRLSPVVVVLGHEPERVRAALSNLAADSRLVFVHNDQYARGQSSSVITGLAAIETAVDAAMFLPADQPLLDCTIIDRLIAAFEQDGRDICHPIVAGRRRGPAIFGARHFAALRRLQGDIGGRSIIDANPDAVAAVSFSDETPFRDIDCPGDLAALLAACPGAGVNRGLSRAHLTRALGLEEARLIAICGAGGKTSLMAALVRELSARGERVLATTTTKMAIEEAEGPWRACEAGGADDLLAHPATDLAPVLAYRAVDRARGRLLGFSPEAIDVLAQTDRFSRIIVEVDGAARKPLKAPAPHEPVFPRTADAVVMVVGASGLGQPLDESTVFRAERWAALTRLRPSQPVSPESLARMVIDPKGLAQGAPVQARRALFINQVDTPERLAAAERVLDCVFGLSGFVPTQAVAGRLEPVSSVLLIRERERCSEAIA